MSNNVAARKSVLPLRQDSAGHASVLGAPGAEAAPTRAGVTLDQIRARAYELYLSRVRHGESGDAGSDWAQAERELKGSPEIVITASKAGVASPRAGAPRQPGRDK